VGGFDALARALLPLSLDAVVVNARDPGRLALARSSQDGRVILYAAAPDCPAVLEHRAKGGAAVWLEEAGEGRCLVLAAGAETQAVMRIGLDDAGPADEAAANLEDVVLAAALAWALGCGERRLRQALAGVRVAEPRAG
jgi:cyanophycin synthetase